MKTLNEVRLFSVAVTVVAGVGNVVLQFLFLPTDLFHQVLFSSSAITVMIAAPISFFIGQQMLAVTDLTIQLTHALDHDPLTGVCTRARFYQLARAQAGLPLAVIVIDIDHFKQVNDRFGHQAGDAALKQVAGCLSANCRADDIFARFGGEEFVILLHGLDLAAAFETAQRLCDRLRATPILLNGRPQTITASFGVASVASVNDLDQAINNADQAVYCAKENGRDQVSCYHGPIHGPAPLRVAE